MKAEYFLQQGFLRKTLEGGNGQSKNTPSNFPLNGTTNHSTSTLFVIQSEIKRFVSESPQNGFPRMDVLMELTCYKVIWISKWQIAKFWRYGTI